MIKYLIYIIPGLTALGAFCVSWSIMHNKAKLKFKIFALSGSALVVLLQFGTLILSVDIWPNLKLFGAQLALSAVSLLVPICTYLALLWGETKVEQTLNKFKFFIIAQLIISLSFIPFFFLKYLVDIPVRSQLSIIFTPLGKTFLIYLILSSVLILAIFENKLKIIQKKEGLFNIYLLMGIFILFIIIASQGLLLGSFNPRVLVFISTAVLLGYFSAILSHFKHFTLTDRLTINREAIYSSLILIIVGAYLILVGIIGKIIQKLGGNVNVFFVSILAVVVTFMFFMTITSLSIKEKFKKFADRIFYKNIYDYRSIWNQFSDTLAFKVDLNQLIDSILTTILEILNVKSGALLIFKDSKSFQLVKKKILKTHVKMKYHWNLILLIGCGV